MTESEPSAPLPVEKVRVGLAIVNLQADLATATQRAVRAEDDVVRLRARVHEAVGECQRRYAPMQKEHDRIQALRREVMARHDQLQAERGRPPGTDISQNDLAISAVLAEELDQARAQLAKVRALSSSWRDLGRTDVAYWWSSLADALDAALDPVSATEAPADPCRGGCGPGYRYGDDGCRHTTEAKP